MENKYPFREKGNIKKMTIEENNRLRNFRGI